MHILMVVGAFVALSVVSAFATTTPEQRKEQRRAFNRKWWWLYIPAALIWIALLWPSK